LTPAVSITGQSIREWLSSPTTWLLLAVAVLLLLGWSDHAQAANVIPEPQFDGYKKDDIIGTMTNVFKKGSNLGLIIMLVVAFIVVAGMAIAGLIRGIQRGEWGTFAGALLGGFIVLAFVGAILYWGGSAVDSIKTSSLWLPAPHALA